MASDTQTGQLRFSDRAVLIVAAIVLWLRAPRMYWRYRRRARRVGQRTHIAVPQSVDDKFAWRKMVDHDPRHVQVSDKLAAGDFLDGIGCKAPRPKVLWSGDSPAEIPDALLRENVVIKSNHACGPVSYQHRRAHEP